MSLPTFHDCRLHHGLSLESFYAYAEESIPMDDIQRFDETGRANPFVADDLLFALSELSGQRYDRTNISGIIYVLANPPTSPTNPQPLSEHLSASPTLLELSLAYNLNINWIGEAIGMEDSEVWDVINGAFQESNRSAIQKILHVISLYTGVMYTLDNVQTQPKTDIS